MIVRRLAAASLAVLLTVTGVRAATLDVDDDGADFPFAPWSSIATALGAANRGDTVRVWPGTYPEQLVILQDVNLIAMNSGGTVLIQPLALPESRASLIRYSVPVTAGILVDAARVIIDGFELDMSLGGITSCSPLLTGVYLRNASGVVRNMIVEGARVTADPTCDSGVGLYVESGKADELFGKPVFGRARVRLLDNVYQDYQKAGMVANGRYTIVSVAGDQAFGSGPTADAVQYGFQIGGAAKARLRTVVARDHASTVPGQTAAGMLLHHHSVANVRRSQFVNGQTGIFVIGDNAAMFGNGFENLTDDGVVFLGNTNRSFSGLLHFAGQSGVFINGFRNAVRGGFMSDMLVGVWIYEGLLNHFGGIRFQDVPIEKQGVYGGSRDLDETHTAAWLTCNTGADCDDGDACTYDQCDVADGLCYYTVVVCEDFNACTDDSCDVTLGCQNVGNVAFCDDQNVCTTGDVCAAGTCAGTAVVDGTGCDDLNVCTTGDVCTAATCAGVVVPDGTPCGGNTCTAGVCG